MVQLKVLSGKQAGTEFVARRFPVRIGRAAASDLRVEEAGVWDRHIEISLSAEDGFVAVAQPNALVNVNGNRTERTVLRNGDLIELGLARIQFWLSPAAQRSLSFREAAVWLSLGILCASEVVIIYLLAH